MLSVKAPWRVILSNSLSGYGAVPNLSTLPLVSGQVYATNTNGISSWSAANIPTSEVMTINQTNPPTLEVKGNMVINGIDLEERLKTIEKVLQIPERDVILERKHPKLKKLYDEYINALGKYRTFEAIKGDENGTT